MEVHIVIISLFLHCVWAESKDVRCKVIRTHSMKAVDCFNKDMAFFSQLLPTDAEVIDFSHNRIRKISAKDLQKYTRLKMLYLNDNAIGTVDEDAFRSKDDLQTLDLSLNSIMKLPPVLFQLPSLKTLYLGQNVNMNIIDTVENAKPIKSPLVHLDINNIMSEDFSELPDLGVLPTLEKYNVSGNKVLNIKVSNFAGLCSLKYLDTTNVSLLFDDENHICECWYVNAWLKNKKVEFRPFDCPLDERDCQKKILQNEVHDKVHSVCKSEVAKIIADSKRRTALYISLPIVAIILIIASIIIYFRFKRWKREKENSKKEHIGMLNYECDSEKVKNDFMLPKNY